MVKRITPRDPKTIHFDLRSPATANLSIQSAMEVVSEQSKASGILLKGPKRTKAEMGQKLTKNDVRVESA